MLLFYIVDIAKEEETCISHSLLMLLDACTVKFTLWLGAFYK